MLALLVCLGWALCESHCGPRVSSFAASLRPLEIPPVPLFLVPSATLYWLFPLNPRLSTSQCCLEVGLLFSLVRRLKGYLSTHLLSKPHQPSHSVIHVPTYSSPFTLNHSLTNLPSSVHLPTVHPSVSLPVFTCFFLPIYDTLTYLPILLPVCPSL